MIKIFYKIYFYTISILVLPIALLFILFGRLSSVIGAYTDVSIIVSHFPFLFGERLRYFYYKGTLKAIGKNVIFRYGTYCQYRNTVIGNNVLFGYFNTIGEVVMGDDIVIGGYVNFISGTNQHSFSDPTQKISTQKASGRRSIKINSDIWIGSNAVIASDIGKRCVIGAASVLVSAAEEYSVYGGNPAKLIRKID